MLGIFSTLFVGFDDDPNKLWVFVEISPRPRLHVDWELVYVALRKCGIEDFGSYKPTNNPVINMKQLSTCLASQIPRENLLFLGGKTFKAFACPQDTQGVFVLGDEPLNDQSSEVAADDGEGNNKYAPKIRLTICAPNRYPDKLEQVVRSKQTEGTRYQNWKKVIGRYFQPAKDVLQPIWRHEHSLIPNVAIERRR